MSRSRRSRIGHDGKVDRGDAQGRWHVENHKAVNGVWLHAGTLPVRGGCPFQRGEQRFLLKILS